MSSGVRGNLRIVWILFLGACALFQLFGGDPEPKEAIAGNVTVFFDTEEEGEMAAKIARQLNGDHYLGTNTSAYTLDLSKEDDGYRLEAVRKKGTDPKAAGFQAMARVLMDECTGDVPVYFSVSDFDKNVTNLWPAT